MELGTPIAAAFPPSHGPSTWGLVVYWGVALLASIFYGVFAVRIFVDKGTRTDRQWSWWAHESWLNFLGSLVGWALAWPLVTGLWPCLSTQCDLGGITWTDAGLAIVAFIGVTGFIPATVVPLALGVGGLAQKVAEIVASWIARR